MAHTHRIHGTGFCMVNVGKYTSPMDPMGMIHFGQPHPVNQVDSHPPGFVFTGFQGNKPSWRPPPFYWEGGTTQMIHVCFILQMYKKLGVRCKEFSVDPCGRGYVMWNFVTIFLHRLFMKNANLGGCVFRNGWWIMDVPHDQSGVILLMEVPPNHDLHLHQVWSPSKNGSHLIRPNRQFHKHHKNQRKNDKLEIWGRKFPWFNL